MVRWRPVPASRGRTLPLGLACVLLLGALGCERKLFYKAPFTADLQLGGKTIPASVLNEGHDVYMHYCHACHGQAGDGNGPSAPGMRPPPRDFRSGVFKFGGVQVGQLPPDEALDRILREGLAGTPMLPWDMTARERHAVIQYIKTFSDAFKPGTETALDVGELIPVAPDPWQGRLDEAREVGKRIYHLSGVENDADGNMRYVLAGCSNCHPSYITLEERTALSKQYMGAPPGELAGLEDMYRPSLKPSEFSAGGYNVQILPPDFLFHPIKTGTAPASLYRTIAAGIAGAAMPTWRGILSEEGLWALTHYVKSVADLRGEPEAVALRNRLMAQGAAAAPANEPAADAKDAPRQR